MPCYDPRDKIARTEAEAFVRKFGPLMCEAVDLLRSLGALEKASPALQAWAREHAERDKRMGR